MDMRAVGFRDRSSGFRSLSLDNYGLYTIRSELSPARELNSLAHSRSPLKRTVRASGREGVHLQGTLVIRLEF